MDNSSVGGHPIFKRWTGQSVPWGPEGRYEMSFGGDVLKSLTDGLDQFLESGARWSRRRMPGVLGCTPWLTDAEIVDRLVHFSECCVVINKPESLPGRLRLVDDHRSFLRSRIRNEPSFRERLLQLVELLGAELVQPFMPNPSKWATTTRDARDSLVHRFPDPTPPDSPDMYVLAEMTSAVITLSLLRELDIPRTQLEDVVRRHPAFQWIAEEGMKWVPQVFTAPAPQA